jgi:hypothetical protein
MKRFNITGDCSPDYDYMVDTTEKINKILKMIYQGDYFVINRPRQYGKTTTLIMLEKALLATDDYLPIKISFEGKAIELFESQEHFGKAFLELLANYHFLQLRGYSSLFTKKINEVSNFATLSKIITEIIQTIDKKIVLLIDEVDKSSNNTLFLEFVGMLRDKFLLRKSQGHITFQSVILAGIHDIKNLKRKIRQAHPEALESVKGEIDTYNSPWNIAVDFKVDLSFKPPEIANMLSVYAKDTNNQMDIPAISQQLYFWTSGYPFLVSKLCKTIAEDIIPERENKDWTLGDVDKATLMLLDETNTLFDDMSKNLENNADLYIFMQSLVLGTTDYRFELTDPVIQMAYMYGMIDKTELSNIKIHNKIFTEKLAYYFISKNKTKQPLITDIMGENYFLKKDGRLDMDKVLLKFQEGIKENINKRDKPFLEQNLRLVFLMFIKNIINGKGFSFKEVQIGEEKRLDIVITFKNEKFVIELKIWRGQHYHAEGIARLKQYMQHSSAHKGYMLIMNNNKNKKIYHETQDDILMVFI